jgi:hypothetical protein
VNISKPWRAVLIICAMIAVWLLFVYISKSIAP